MIRLHSRRAVKRLVIACLFAPLAACRVSAPSLPPISLFDPDEAGYVHKIGAARIEGRAVLALADGEPIPAAGEVVRLIPATTYAKARFAAIYGDKTFLPAWEIPEIPVDPAYAQNLRTTKASDTGAFRFDNVAAGDYIVVTQKIWQETGSFYLKGGAMFARVTVKGRGLVKAHIIGR